MSWASIVGSKPKVVPVAPYEAKSSTPAMNFDLENLPWISNDDRDLGVHLEEKNMIGVDIMPCSQDHFVNDASNADHHVTTNGITHCRITRSLLRIAYPVHDQGFVLLSYFHPYYWNDVEGKNVGATRYLIFIPVSQTYLLVVTNQFGHAHMSVVWCLLDNQIQADNLHLQKCWCVTSPCTCDGAWKEGNNVWEEGDKIMHEHADTQIVIMHAIRKQLDRYLPPVLRDIVWSYYSCKV